MIKPIGNANLIRTAKQGKRGNAEDESKESEERKGNMVDPLKEGEDCRADCHHPGVDDRNHSDNTGASGYIYDQENPKRYEDHSQSDEELQCLNNSCAAAELRIELHVQKKCSHDDEEDSGNDVEDAHPLKKGRV